MKLLPIVGIAIMTLSFSAAPALAAGEPPPMPADKLQQEMAQVPTSDPSTPNAPTLLDVVKGKHPRLLFSADDIAALKSAIAGDPILQKAYDGNKQWATISQVPVGPRPPIIADDTSALVKSWSQAPAMAYAYALDHDPAMKDKIVATLNEMLSLEHWTDNGGEIDCNMGCACNMMMTALLFDTVYNDLDPDLRAKLAQKIFTHARRMYYLGHKQLSLPFPGKGFWQQDPQPNHRWYRDMGLAACVLAVADEQGIDASYLLQGLKDEMDFVIKWYPPDGDCHEGAGYQSFGYTPIATACEMMDRNLGTDYLKKSGLKNAWAQQIYYWVPGRLSDISWGDDQNSIAKSYSHNDASFFLGPRLSQDPLAQALLLMRMDRTNTDKDGKPGILPWTMLAFYDPTVKAGDYKTGPLYRIFPDIGGASMRDSWEDNAVVFTFKCGPYGGYKLNEYRNTTMDDGRPHGINIAHDDPDANEFALAVGNGFAFHPGVYSSADVPPFKVTTDHSTILVDGKGQVGEGSGYTQPVGNEDMTKFSYLTGWKTDGNGHVIIEGEAGNAYHGQSGPQLKAAGNKLADAVLTKYRRTAVWMPGEYILILDNIAANGPHAITWLGTAPKSQVTNGQGTVTTETGTPVNFQTVSNKEFQSASKAMNLIGRWGSVPVQQVQLSAQSDAIKFATVIDPWKKNAQVKMSDAGGTTTVTVHSDAGDDTWTWVDPKDSTTPSQVDGKRSGAELISLTEADVAPKE